MVRLSVTVTQSLIQTDLISEGLDCKLFWMRKQSHSLKACFGSFIHCASIIMCSNAAIAAIRTRAGNAVLPCCQSIRVMTPPPPIQHCHSPLPSLAGLILPEAHTPYKQHTDTYIHKVFLSLCRFLSLSLSARPPYLLAFLPVADALSLGIKRFWGIHPLLWGQTWAQQGNGKVKQAEQHYYSTNKCTSYPDSSVPACHVLCCPLSELCHWICTHTETWYQPLYKL